MKAIVKKHPVEGGLELCDVPEPIVSSSGVLIKVKKTAICGTDIHIYKWDAWAQRKIKTPQIIGHEFVGEVVEVGRDVFHIKTGDLVSAEGHVVCGACKHCRTGNLHLCPTTVGFGVDMDGVFSEYVSVPASNVWVCGKKIPTDVLSVLDPLGNAIHTALSYDVLGKNVLVTGAGPIGLMSIPILIRAGARNVVVTDLNEARLDLASALGAKTVNVAKQKLSEVVATMPGMGDGFCVGLEMSGSAQALADMVENMENGGEIAVLGIMPLDTRLNWDRIVFGCLTIKGIYGRKMYDTWYKGQAMLESGLAEDIAGLITHRYSYRDYEEAFKLMESGMCGKVVLTWEF